MPNDVISVDEWMAMGQFCQLCGHSVFTLDVGPAESSSSRELGEDREEETVLVIHGYPTCSFDFRHILSFLSRRRRVVLLDLVGFGLSDKPDMSYTLNLQADVVSELCSVAGVSRVALLTHDMGDTVGGELLARHAEGRWSVEVTRRLLFNGSIYIEMAHLSPGQLLLLDMPDAPLPDEVVPDGPTFQSSLASTLSPRSVTLDDEWPSQWRLAAHNGGTRLLARTIRYIEERRRHQSRYTGAIETHPSPLGVIWGEDDPIAIVAMADRLQQTRPGTPTVVLDGVGHFPMVEAPGRVIEAMTDLGW